MDCTGVGSGTINVTVDLSTGNAPTFAQRFMLGGAQHLNYNLYTDASGSSIWGDGTGGSVEFGPVAVANNKLVTLSVFGRMPPGQDLAAGAYGDTITATMNF